MTESAPQLGVALVEGLLEAGVTDLVAAPGRPGWDAARAAWNLAVDQHPAAVVAVRDEADVAAAVRIARAAGTCVVPQPRGHGAVPGLVDGAVVLRTGALDQVVVDVDRRWMRVGAGVRWGRALAALDGTGLVALAGSSPDVTVTGYVTNGGLSWFSRVHGLGAHSVTAVELVDAEGVLRRVEADRDPELFWAVRGGGGGLGVVTAVELELVPAPTLLGGKILVHGGDAAAVLRTFAEVTADAPRALSVWASLLHLPDSPDVPEPMRGGSFAVVDWTALSTTGDVLDRVEELRHSGRVIVDTSGPLAVGSLGGVAAEPVDPTPGLADAFPLGRFEAADAAALVSAAGEESGTPLTSVMVRHVGGALGDPEPEPGAYGPVGSLPDPYLAFALGVPAPGGTEAVRAGIAEVGAVLAPAASGGRIVPTFLGERPAAEAYAPGNLARLRRLSAERDPHGTIRPARPLG